jgi:hypothetical protein
MAHINFHGFKLVHRDENKAILKKGPHEMHLAIKALHPGNQAELAKLPLHKSNPMNPKLAESKKSPKMADGGKVAESKDLEIEEIPGADKPFKTKDGLEIEPVAEESKYADGGDVLPIGDRAAPSDVPVAFQKAPDDVAAPGSIDYNNIPEEKSFVIQPSATASPDQSRAGGGPQPTPQPLSSSPPSSSAPQSPDASAQLPNGMYSQLANSLPQSQQAEKNIAAVQSEADRQLAQFHEDNANLMKKMYTNVYGGTDENGKPVQGSLAEHQQEINNLTQDIKNNHIDPSRYMSSLGTGSKILTGIGIILGGGGSAVTGQPNYALDFVNKQIDRDIQAQVAEQGKKENLVSMYTKMMGNEREGVAMASAAMAKITADKMMAIAEKADGGFLKGADGKPILDAQGKPVAGLATQRAQLASQELLQKYFPMLQQASIMQGARQALQNHSSTPQSSDYPINISKMNSLAVGAHLKIPGFPTSEDIQNMTKEAGTLSEARATRNDFNNAFDSLDKDFLAGKLSPNARNSYVNSLAGRLAKASAGRYNENEARNQIESMIPEPSDWKSTRDIKRQNNDKFFDILESSTPTLDRFGLKNPPVNHSSKAPVQSMEGKVGTLPDGTKVKMVNGKIVKI